MDIKHELRDYAQEIGIVAIGVTGPDPLEEARPIYEKRIGRGYLTAGMTPRPGFEEKSLDLRFNPQLSFPEVKSVVSLAVPYNVEYTQPQIPRYHGQVARVGWGRDYHVVVSEKMTKIVQFLRDQFPDLKYEMMVDTGPLIDRGFAWRAGIGWIGKNNTLIVPHIGSFVFIGEILINKILEPDLPIDKDCGKCVECLKACPTKALVAPYMLDTKICMSFLTQIPELPPGWIIPKLEGRIYGCDICQEVCPFNKTAPKLGDRAFLPTTFEPYPDLLDLINMDLRRYISMVGQTSAEWIGRSIIQRNAILGLSGYRESNTLSHIKRLQRDERPSIKKVAIWAENYIRGEPVQ